MQSRHNVPAFHLVFAQTSEHRETFRAGRVLCSLYYESADSIHWMVHPVRALLAHRATCIVSLPSCLANVSSIAAHRHHRGGRVYPGSDAAFFAGSPARMAEAAVCCAVKKHL
jgi:hypothetical protein